MITRPMADALVSISPRARAELIRARSEDPDPERLGLWLEVTGVDGGEYVHNMFFDLVSSARPDDVVESEGDLTVVIPRDSVDKLRGASIDLADPVVGGWSIDNPNNPSPAVGASASEPSALSGDVTDRVAQLLELHINPAIAAHGGHADLVSVQDGTAFVRLSGGCQGCGMAKVTLTQGIEVAITEAIPEVSRVVDVTDHSSGTNPYFTPTKG